jgi:hypothetical protein
MLRRPEGATVDEVASATGWQRHTVRGVFSGTLKKKLGLTIASANEERNRVYRNPRLYLTIDHIRFLPLEGYLAIVSKRRHRWSCRNVGSAVTIISKIRRRSWGGVLERSGITRSSKDSIASGNRFARELL